MLYTFTFCFVTDFSCPLHVFATFSKRYSRTGRIEFEYFYAETKGEISKRFATIYHLPPSPAVPERIAFSDLAKSAKPSPRPCHAAIKKQKIIYRKTALRFFLLVPAFGSITHMLDSNGFFFLSIPRSKSYRYIKCVSCVRAGAELTDCDTPLWTTVVNTQRVKRPEAPSPVKGRPSSLAYINVGGNVSREGKKNKNPRNLYNAISYARTLLAIESLLFTGRLSGVGCAREPKPVIARPYYAYTKNI